MSSWRLQETPDGVRLAPLVRRALGVEEFTWADLLAPSLLGVEVFAVYFPTRFEQPVDEVVRTALRTFGQHTSTKTSVNFWDPQDPQFTAALELFDLRQPPAVVLTRGLLAPGGTPKPDRYMVAITDPAVLADADCLGAAINTVHELLMRGDAREISGYVRGQAGHAILTAIERIASGLRDQVLAFKPKVSLPGGISVQLG